MKLGVCLSLLALMMLCADVRAQDEKKAMTDEQKAAAKLKAKAQSAVDRGLRFLHDNMGKDGSWANHPGVTGIVLLALLKSHRNYDELDGPFIRKPVKYLLGLQKKNGAIYQKELANYTTAIAIQALLATKNPKYMPAIMKARNYLVGSQLDEGEGYETVDSSYGAYGYGSSLRPDMSNTQISADALKAAEMAGIKKDSDVWKRMVIFASRCQNRSESNDRKDWPGNDGGVVYSPGQGKGKPYYKPDGTKGIRSYGSMTYAFLKCMIYADVKKDDERVKSAYKWIQKNYTLDENPGLGKQGLYYYYHTMAKALKAYGEPILVDDKGVKHDWRAELTEKILELQKEDGSWVNANDRWWEQNPVLVTAYGCLILEELTSD